MLSLATSTYTINAISFIMFAQPISMPRFKGIIFNKIALKLSYISEKKMFSSAGGSAPDPVPPALTYLTVFL